MSHELRLSSEFMAALRHMQVRELATPAEGKLFTGHEARIPDLYSEQEAKIAALEAENQRLRTALQKYADEENKEWR